MAFPAFSVMEVSFAGSVDGQRVLTTRHYTNRFSIPDSVSIALLMQGFLDSIQEGEVNDLVTSYLAVCATDYLLTQVRVQVVAPTRIRFYQTPKAAAGTFAGLTQATNINGTITFQTQKAGRNQISTIHPPALAEGTYTSGLLGGAIKTALSALGDKLTEPVALPGLLGVWFPVIWHRKVAGIDRVDGIENYTVSDTVRVMRRRTVGLGI